MNRSNLSVRLVIRVTATVLAACFVGSFVSACDRDNGEHTPEEIDQLQTDFEQLANQVGRLEFRIYELENNQASQPPTDDAAADPDAKGDSPVKPSAEKGRIDLTPVEP
jgi:outer membrane murein-binding lipoprotein Lpp